MSDQTPPNHGPAPALAPGQLATASADVYAVFCGNVDQLAVQRIFQGMTFASTHGVKQVHLLVQSVGGNVGDGICLYNFFRALPLKLTLYNVGAIYSIACIVYLGASERKASAGAAFTIHRSYASVQAATSERLQASAKGLILDDKRTEAILRQHLTLSDNQWNTHKSADLWFSAEEAVKSGLATAIGEFTPPKGSQVFHI